MTYNFNKEAKLFMVFDILGDTERSGPLLWKIDRKRIEDVKNHILDLLLMYKILRSHFPSYLNDDIITDYIIGHDLPEAITGDITKFEGVSNEEIERVTNIAIGYLINKFGNIWDFSSILLGYENKVNLEAKIVHMLDKAHSSTTFIKYQSEKDIDMANPEIIAELRNNPFVVKKIAEGKDLGDIFFEFYLKEFNFTDAECEKYDISRESADKIANVVKAFTSELYSQKQAGTLLDVKDDFPLEAMIYNRNK